jgi:hypothetical protein
MPTPGRYRRAEQLTAAQCKLAEQCRPRQLGLVSGARSRRSCVTRWTEVRRAVLLARRRLRQRRLASTTAGRARGDVAATLNGGAAQRVDEQLPIAAAGSGGPKRGNTPSNSSAETRCTVIQRRRYGVGGADGDSSAGISSLPRRAIAPSNCIRFGRTATTLRGRRLLPMDLSRGDAPSESRHALLPRGSGNVRGRVSNTASRIGDRQPRVGVRSALPA